MKLLFQYIFLLSLLLTMNSCKPKGKKGTKENAKTSQSITSFGSATKKDVATLLSNTKERPWVPSVTWEGERKKRISMSSCEHDDEVIFKKEGDFINKVNDQCEDENDDHGWWKVIKKNKSFFLLYSYNGSTFKFKIKKLTDKKLVLLKIRPAKKIAIKTADLGQKKKFKKKFINRPRKVLYTFEFER